MEIVAARRSHRPYYLTVALASQDFRRILIVIAKDA